MHIKEALKRKKHWMKYAKEAHKFKNQLSLKKLIKLEEEFIIQPLPMPTANIFYFDMDIEDAFLSEEERNMKRLLK